jgi:hypothetical protein
MHTGPEASAGTLFRGLITSGWRTLCLTWLGTAFYHTENLAAITGVGADEKAHDSTEFSTGPWLEDSLELFDQVYFKYSRFGLINENDGYFLSRLKKNVNPEITAELREWRGDAIPLEGERVQDVVNDLYREYIDVELKATFQRREYAADPDACGLVANADVNGAENIRQNGLPNLATDGGDRDNGWMAQPAVRLFDKSTGRVRPQEQATSES